MTSMNWRKVILELTFPFTPHPGSMDSIKISDPRPNLWHRVHDCLQLVTSFQFLSSALMSLCSIKCIATVCASWSLSAIRYCTACFFICCCIVICCIAWSIFASQSCHEFFLQCLNDVKETIVSINELGHQSVPLQITMSDVTSILASLKFLIFNLSWHSRQRIVSRLLNLRNQNVAIQI